MPDIVHLLRVDAPPARLYDALTTADGVRGWWTRDADLDNTVGGRGVFRFYDGARHKTVAIERLDPPVRVVWNTVASSPPDGWLGTTISFDLRPDGDGTMVAFAHRGFAEEDDGYAMVSMGWAYFLVSLRQYVETGEGGPHPDVDFFRMMR